MNLLVLLKFLGAALLPPASIAIGVIAGLVLMAIRLRRTGKAIAVLAVLQGILLASPPVADALISPLEREAREAARRAEPCSYSAIVLLGGGVMPAAPPAMPSAHLLEAADRIVHAAQLFHRRMAPKIGVSGGKVRNVGDTEAQAMKNLLMQLGVPAEAIVLEGRSRNTLENIAFVHQIVGADPVALVTSAYHMPRALRIARRIGLEAAAFPTDWRLPKNARPAWENWLPSLDAERASAFALHEYMAQMFDFRRPAP